MRTRTMRDVYQILRKTLGKWYIGDGLYVDIDKFIIEDPVFDDEVDLPPAYVVVGSYGRNNFEDPTYNFQFKFSLRYLDEDSDDFIGGMFFQIMTYNEDGMDDDND